MELSWEDIGMTEQEFKSLSREELHEIPHDQYWWTCCVGDCKHRTTLRDYGIGEYYWSNKHEWFRADTQIYFCAEHWKRYRKMIARNHRPPEGIFRKDLVLKILKTPTKALG